MKKKLQRERKKMLIDEYLASQLAIYLHFNKAINIMNTYTANKKNSLVLIFLKS